MTSAFDYPERIITAQEFLEMNKLQADLQGANGAFAIIRDTPEWERLNELSGKWQKAVAWSKGITAKDFKVVSVSSNANSFGLHGVIILAQDGQGFEVGITGQFLPAKGDVLSCTVCNKTGDLKSIHRHSYEIPRMLPKAPEAVIKEVWK